MSGPSDRRFDLNLGEETATPSPDNIWRPSFISPTGPLTVGDSVMKNDMTAAVVARNLLTPKDNRLLSKRSDELAVKDSLALSVQCAGSVSNMAQRLFARTRQVESLAAEVMSLKQEIRGLKHENKQLHRLAHDYATNMKRKLDQMKESDGKVLLDHQRFVGLFQRHLLPSSSRVVPGNEASNDEPPMPPPSGVLSSTEAPDNHPPYNSRNPDQHAFFIEVVPQLVNYNISKFEIPRSCITQETQIFETSQQLRNLQEADYHVWSFNTLISVAQTEMVPS
ncbi:hypothetical protein EV2_011373 [Malus domestica]